MAVSIKLPSGITVTSAATKIKDIFKDLSFWGSEFPTKCGNCKSSNLAPSYRETKDGDSYYEAKCGDCGHTLGFGQYKAGEGLFAKRKDGWRPPYTGGSERQEAPKKQDDDDSDTIPY